MQAQEAKDEGFTHPLAQLAFDPDAKVFERSTFDALDIDDPLGSFNRRIYHFNYRLDQWVMLPAMRGYQKITPKPIRQGLSNFFLNLGDVGNLANNLLQLKLKRAMQTTARLLFNSILGVGGLWDPATRMGLTRHTEDFGQTLGHYGVPAGPYLILPVLGPSSLRDATGLVSDYWMASEIDWMRYYDASNNHPELSFLHAIDTRYSIPFRYGQLDSPFEYDQLRYIYTRARQIQVTE